VRPPPGGLVLSTGGLVALAAPATAAIPLPLYVAAYGSDRYNNCEFPERPCRTLGHAISEARDDAYPDIVISVVGGAAYDGEDTINLPEARSLTIEPAPGTGTVTVTGAGGGGGGGGGDSVFTVEQGASSCAASPSSTAGPCVAVAGWRSRAGRCC
jgi:hypothetical protein